MEKNKHEFHNRVSIATKWSALTEILAKLITPITSMILARLLSPNAFGVVATVTMITSFAEMISDAGFQKYLVQFQFNTPEEKKNSTNVAFWTNIGIVVIIWSLILLFNEELAILVGSPGLGHVIIIASLQLPLTSLASIQIALYKRELDFKTLFSIRIISIILPFLITIPLAFIGLGFWSIIIGSITMQMVNAIILTLKSKWHPTFYYQLSTLKKMVSFSLWTTLESISIWLTVWIDTFIIAKSLDQYYVGLYKTSTTLVNSIFSLFSAALIPVLFSALSRLQKDVQEFEETYFKFQRLISYFIFPFGIGLYIFSDLATRILLGNKWLEASEIVGVWSITSTFMIVFGHFCSEAYRARGMPKLSFLAQILHLIVLVPICIIASKFGFWTLIQARAWIRIEFVFVHLILMQLYINISIVKTMKNTLPYILSSIFMGLVAYILLSIFKPITFQILIILLSIIIYILLISKFSNRNTEVAEYFSSIIPSRFKNYYRNLIK